MSTCHVSNQGSSAAGIQRIKNKPSPGDDNILREVRIPHQLIMGKSKIMDIQMQIYSLVFAMK